MEGWINSYIENAENKNDDEIYYELVNKFNFLMGSYMESVLSKVLDICWPIYPKKFLKAY